MTQEKVDAYLLANAKYFPVESIMVVRDKLLSIPEEKMINLQSIEFKDPNTLLLVSVLIGAYGVDRFMEGNVGMGILKLLTGGVCGIMTIYDWCTIKKRTKKNNLNKLLTLI